MRRKLIAGFVAVVALTTACSVSTPRNGESLSATDGRDAGSAGGGAPAGADGDGGAAATAGGGELAFGDGGANGGAASGAGADGSDLGGSGAGASGGPGGNGATGATRTAGTAGASGPVPGVTEDSITVSVIAGFSGPLAGMVEHAYGGLQTWQEDVNDGGGIHGRRVVLKKVDHKETADGGVAACKEALSNGSFFAAVPEGIDANLTAVSCLDAAGMPTLYFSATTDPAWKRAFSDVITSAQGGHILGSYVANVLGGRSKKVGIVYVNQPAYEEVAKTFVPEARRLGVDVVSTEAVEPNQASFTPQLLRMQQKGVEILVISATAEAIGILRDARSMGWAPTVTGWGYLFDFVTQAARNLFDGVTGLRVYAATDAPAFERYAARMAARGRSTDRKTDLESFSAYGHGLLIGELLQRAGPNPTHESFVLGAETIKGYDNGILPPITYGPGDHIGADAGFASVCCTSEYTWKAQGAPRAAF